MTLPADKRVKVRTERRLKVIAEHLKTISLEELNHKFSFDFENGKIYWKNPPKCSKRKGDEAGCFHRTAKNKAYWVVMVKYKSIYRSRLIHYAYYGFVSEKIIDHINGDSLDDRLSNLREADRSQNIWNTKTRRTNKTGLPQGVRVMSPNRFGAKIAVRGKNISLGSFLTAESAGAAYQAARKKFFGEFA
jgi:hypothetical protein